MEAGWVEQGRERVGHVNRVGYVNGGVISKRRRLCRRIHKRPKALQKLFVSCTETFKGPHSVPSQEHVHTLCSILDEMKPEDVGLSRDLQFFKPAAPTPNNLIKDNQRVTYTTIYKSDHFSLCIFFVPEGGVIPLHNHPGMTVFSKLLLGQLHIKSYDWLPNHSSLSHQHSKLRLAKLKCDRVFRAPCDASVLYPTTGGNMHEFTAITPCAVLDVIGPPYSKEDGRDCSYYKDHPYHAFSNNNEEDMTNKGKEVNNDSYWWLEEIEVPENSHMDGIEYLGPPIAETSF